MHQEPEGGGPEPLDRRTLVAAALACSGAALVTGGIFGSVTARLLATAAAGGGVAWSALVVRSTRPALLQLLLGPIAVAAGVLTVLPSGHGPADVADLVGDAIDAGRLLSPPVPFDAGWRPVLVVVFALLGYGAGWLGVVVRKPIAAVALPLPVIGLTAITQPDDAQFAAGLLAFAPLAAALAVLFSTGAGAGLSREFELKRGLRAAGGGIVVLALLLGSSQLTFLFPEPAYDPTDQPQKPRAVPLSEARDRVLFTAVVPAGFTGPWRTGALDVYDDGEWKLPGGTADRLQPIPADGSIDALRSAAPDALELTLTTGEIGASPVVPIVPTATRVDVTSIDGARYDPRTGTIRVASGRVPSGRTYRVVLPPYPSATELAQAGRLDPPPGTFEEALDAPRPPRAVVNVIDAAPAAGWARLDHVRHQLLDDVTAAGPGTPVDTPPSLVEDLLVGSRKGTPFEIVAAQVLLARWSGFPARIGFGFNGGEARGGVLEIRPKHAAQWLEVHLDGYGWVPLLDVPPQAEASLDDDEDPDSNVTASDDISVGVLVPVEVRDPRLLFEIVRARILQALPIVALALLAHLASPWIARALRSRRRAEWAAELGPRARIGVAYAELRDLATDLGVGDPFATPIEYLARVERDDEHVQLAWLVSRVMYGDLALTASEGDAIAAEDMSRSLRQRLWRAQPLQTRALALVSRASLGAPYSDEAPNVALPGPIARVRAVVSGAARLRPRFALPRRRTA